MLQSSHILIKKHKIEMYFSREKLIKTVMLASIVFVCVSIVSVILTAVNQFKAGSQLASVNQVANLSHLLVRQQANILALMLVKNAKNDELTETLDNFAKEAFVIDANLHSPSGSLIAQSQNALDLKVLLDQKLTSAATQQIVEPIVVKEELIGFLRVTVDTEYGQTTKHKIDELFNQLYAELIILFLAGGLLISSIYHYLRKKSVAYQPTKLPLAIVKKQAGRFHSRRRLVRRR